MREPIVAPLAEMSLTRTNAVPWGRPKSCAARMPVSPSSSTVARRLSFSPPSMSSRVKGATLKSVSIRTKSRPGT